MTTYIEDEATKHDGKPKELYRFAGTYTTYRYTSHNEPVMFQAPDEDEEFQYIPTPVKRSAVHDVTAGDDNDELTIDIPVGIELIIVYGFQISPPDLFLTIFRGHNTDYVAYWAGDVENISVVSGKATIRVPSQLAARLALDFPQAYFQTPCNHTLFDARCTMNFDDFSDHTTILSIDGNTVSLSGIDPALDGVLVGGDAVLASGERRMITAQAGNLITVNYPFSQGAPFENIIISAGCDLAWDGDCDTRFHNTVNHGGFPFLPNVNIFSLGITPGQDMTNGQQPGTQDCGVYTMQMRLRTNVAPYPDGFIGKPGLGNSLGMPGGSSEFEDTVSFCGQLLFYVVSQANAGPGVTDLHDAQEVHLALQFGTGSEGCETTGDGKGICIFEAYRPEWGEWRFLLASTLNPSDISDQDTTDGSFLLHASGFPGHYKFTLPAVGA